MILLASLFLLTLCLLVLFRFFKKVFSLCNQFLDFCTIKICYFVSIILIKKYKLTYEEFVLEFKEAFWFLEHDKEFTLSPYYVNVYLKNEHYWIRMTFRVCLDSCYGKQDEIDKVINIGCFKKDTKEPILKKHF